MASLIIQHKAKHGRLTEFSKHVGDTVTLGRALTSDLVLSDPYVAPEQVRFYTDNKKWCMHVLDSTNPVLVNGEVVTGDDIQIHSGDQLVIGRTNVSLLTEDHSIEPTRKLVLSRWWHRHMFKPISLFALLCTVVFLQVLNDYQGLSTMPKWGPLLLPAMVTVVVIICWAGLWALVGRMLRHHPHFNMQLFFTALIFGAWIFAEPLNEYAEYISNSLFVSEIVLWSFYLITSTLLLKYNLSYATNLQKPTTVSLTFASIFLLFIFAVNNFSEYEFSSSPKYSGVIKHVNSAILNTSSPEQFLAKYSELFGDIERQARK